MFEEPLWTYVTITPLKGSPIRGVVQGSGGVIRDLSTVSAVSSVQGLIRRANEGNPLPVYEPRPGHVKVYQTMDCDGAKDEALVDLRGAQVGPDVRIY